MEPAGLGQILKLLLVLFLSVKDAPQDAGRGPALEALAPAGAVGAAVLDVAQLRAMIRDHIIYILPRTIKFNTERERREFYEHAADIYRMA